MITLLESPMPWIFLGVIVEALLAALYFSSRRGGLLLAMLGVLFLVVGGLLVERFVVTEREEVEITLDGAAAAIESNDLTAARRYLARTASDTLQRLSHYMQLVEFDEVKIRNVEIEINRLTSPPTAEVHLYGVAHFTFRNGEIPYNNYAAGFQLELVREPDGWKVEDIQGDPMKPYDAR